MDRLRTLVIGGALASVAITSVAAPVGALDTTGTLAIVNGVPGQLVDVCVNGSEIKSKLAYGKAVLRNSISATPKTLDIYKPDPRNCRGNRIAHSNPIALPAAGDLTIVVTKFAPKFVIFDNAGLGEIPPNGGDTDAYIALRHAAEFPATFKVTLSFPEVPLPPEVAADPVWTKGDEYADTATETFVVKVRVTRPNRSRTVAARGPTTILDDTRHEWILVGTTVDNARLAYLARRVSAPTP